MDMWNSRTPRERMLLMAALTLILLLVINILIVSPVRKARADAFANLSVSTRTLDAVTAALSVTGPASARPEVTISGEQLRSRLVEIAAGNGISVSRLQSGQNGEIIIHFDNASAPLVFSWLDQAEGETGVKPQHVSIFSGANGTIRASFEFQGAGS